MKKFIVILLLINAFCYAEGIAKSFKVVSPDKNLQLELEVGSALSYKVQYKGNAIIDPSVVALTLSDRELGLNPKLKSQQSKSVREFIHPLYGKFDSISNNYNELKLDFEDNYSLIIRAYNDAVAYRFVTAINSDIVVKNEKATFNVSGSPSVIFPETDTYNSWELTYFNYKTTSAVDDKKRAITPVMFSFPKNIKAVVAESDVWDYPGMYLEKSNNSFCGAFAKYPDSVALGSWGNFVSVVQRRADCIAKTSGKREFPWRIVIVTDDDRSLLTNEVVYKLSRPQAISDVSWIKPGKATWEWWHEAQLPGAAIPSGNDNRNTALYKYYIDFAAANNIEYLLIDAGWSHIFDLSNVNPKIDIRELINYGKSKKVGVFLWCVATALVDDPDKFLKMMSEWGAAGIKVDFFDRDDQLAMGWYELIARKAAEYKLMVDFHGCSKPTGMQRAYPNVVNYEAVRGAECSKWDLTANPVHHLTFPFTRMLGGSIDYTPGSMRNRTQQMFKPLDPGMPLTQGTRSHELAMYVIFDQYFAMLCDSPTEYEKYGDVKKFLSDVPVTFNETLVLEASVGEYALMAKRKGSDWYVGGMTNWTARETEIDLSFLKPGTQYTAEIFTDDHQSNIYADKYKFEIREVDFKTKLKVKMASGGGVALRIHEK